LQAPLLSIIIPAYNESSRLGHTLNQVLEYLRVQPYTSEVLVIDDGSNDTTVEVATTGLSSFPKEINTRVIQYQPNRGKGYAVRLGLLAASGTIALFSDADLSTPISELPKLLDPVVAGEYDIVFGSRALDPTLVGIHQPWLRERSGRLFNSIMRIATRLPYSDTQCGFKAFRLSVCRPIIEGAVLDRFGFDVELLYLAYHAGLRLCEQPVRWNDAAESKVSLFSGLDGFRELQQLRRRAKQGHYEDVISRTKALL
jgi:dolichyl-phosphate beta-glucosyltransferase